MVEESIASVVANAFDIRSDLQLENSLLYPIPSYITINTLDKLCQNRKSEDLNRKRQNLLKKYWKSEDFCSWWSHVLHMAIICMHMTIQFSATQKIDWCLCLIIKNYYQKWTSQVKTPSKKKKYIYIYIYLSLTLYIFYLYKYYKTIF